MLESWQRSVWAGLARAIEREQLPHAILIHGPAGIGKRVLARALVGSLLCRDRGADGLPCGGCRGCRLLAAGTHPDHHQVGLEEDSRQLKVDQVRELARKVALTSSEGGSQVFAVDPADRLNVNAANALLKTLEEPRAQTLIVLVAEAPAKLPITVLSRCQKVAAPIPDRADALDWLARVAPDSDPGQRETAIEAAAGAPGVAHKLLSEDFVGCYTETLDDLAALAAGRGDPVDVAGRWAASSPALRLGWMARALHDASWSQARGLAGESGLTGRIDLASLGAFEQVTNRTRALLDSNLRPEQLIEALLMDWMAGAVRKSGGWSW